MSGQIKPPEMEKTPPKNELANVMGTMAVLTMGCELGDPSKKAECQQILKPLEEGKEKPVDTMTKIIVKFGPEFMDEAMDSINMLTYEAMQRAKEQLIAQGKLNKDGTPIE